MKKKPTPKEETALHSSMYIVRGGFFYLSSNFVKRLFGLDVVDIVKKIYWIAVYYIAVDLPVNPS